MAKWFGDRNANDGFLKTLYNLHPDSQLLENISQL